MILPLKCIDEASGEITLHCPTCKTQISDDAFTFYQYYCDECSTTFRWSNPLTCGEEDPDFGFRDKSYIDVVSKLHRGFI